MTDQTEARQAAIGYTVECLPQATVTWSIECDPGRLFTADGRLDPDAQPCRFIVDGVLMFEADTPVLLFERIREHMDEEASDE